MEVFRLSSSRWSKTLSGKGAALKGARWNSPGTEIIYTSSNRSLAMAEVAVHFTLATLPDDYIMTTIFIPDDVSFKAIQEKNLPKDWNSFPYGSTTQSFGDEFINQNKYCILKIPSAVTRGDFNILINPAHPEFKKIRIIQTEPFPYDLRIFK
jgi:RES domain-containing protein